MDAQVDQIGRAQIFHNIERHGGRVQNCCKSKSRGDNLGEVGGLNGQHRDQACHASLAGAAGSDIQNRRARDQ